MNGSSSAAYRSLDRWVIRHLTTANTHVTELNIRWWRRVGQVSGHKRPGRTRPLRWYTSPDGAPGPISGSTHSTCTLLHGNPNGKTNFSSSLRIRLLLTASRTGTCIVPMMDTAIRHAASHQTRCAVTNTLLAGRLVHDFATLRPVAAQRASNFILQATASPRSVKHCQAWRSSTRGQLVEAFWLEARRAATWSQTTTTTVGSPVPSRYY